MNFDSSSKIVLSNNKEAQVTNLTGRVEQFTSQGASDNPARNFVDQLLQRIENLGHDADSTKDLLLRRNTTFTNLRLLLNDSEIIDYFQKFVDGADIPIEETLDLFDLAYETNMKIGKNIREILEFILNHRSWNRNPELTKDIVKKTTELATSTSTRFFPYFSMLLAASDPGSKDLSSINLISGLDLDSQNAFREIVNLAAKTDKDTVESIRIQQQAAEDALNVARDKYSLTRGIVETLEKSSYEERLSKTIMKLDNLFRKRYSTPGYRQIKLMMFDLHFGQQIYKELFADLNSTTDLRSRRTQSSSNKRIAFDIDTFTVDEINEYNQEDFEDLDNYINLTDKLRPQQKQLLENIVQNVKKDLLSLVNDPKNYKNNYSKVMDNFINSLEKISKIKTASFDKRIALAAPPSIPAPISAALAALSRISGVGPLIAPLTSAITSALSALPSVFTSNMNLIIQTIADGLNSIASFSGIIDVPKIINAISSNNIGVIQTELTKFMNGTAFTGGNVQNFLDLLKLTAIVNRDFSTVVQLMMTQALLRKNQLLRGRRPLPRRRVTQQERENITQTLEKLSKDKTKNGLLIQLKDFREKTLTSLNNQKELAESFKSAPSNIPGVTADAQLTGNEYVQSIQEYYNNLSKSIKMFQYEKQLWESLEPTSGNQQALSVFLKANVSEIQKDIQNVTKKIGEVYLLGIGDNARTDINIRLLEQENVVTKALYDSEKNLGVELPLSSITLRENLVEQRNEYNKLLESTKNEYKLLQNIEEKLRTTTDYENAYKDLQDLIGKQLIKLQLNPSTVDKDIKFRLDVLYGMIKNLEKKIIELGNEIVNTSQGTRSSMSKFEKIVKHSDEKSEKFDTKENVKEADEVTEDYWNELLPGFGSAMEKPKKWRKKLTEDIPVKFHHTRKWTS